MTDIVVSWWNTSLSRRLRSSILFLVSQKVFLSLFLTTRIEEKNPGSTSYLSTKRKYLPSSSLAGEFEIGAGLIKIPRRDGPEVDRRWVYLKYPLYVKLQIPSGGHVIRDAIHYKFSKRVRRLSTSSDRVTVVTSQIILTLYFILLLLSQYEHRGNFTTE